MTLPACPGCPEYQSLARRTLMMSRRAALAVGGGAVLSALAAPAWMPRVALARDYRSSMRDVIVAVYLRGASDGLTMCVPWGDNAYYTNRPFLNVPRPDSGLANRAINLDGFFGLPPGMAALKPAYDDGRLLIVHATGSKDPTRSHFEAQRFMEVGKPADPSLGTGWLGRHLAAIPPMLPGALLRGVGIASGLQQSLAGAPDTLPVPDLDTFGLTGSSSTNTARTNALRDMYQSAREPVRVSALDTFATIDLLNTINFSGYAPAGNAVYPSGSFGYALRTTAALIKAERGVEAVAIDLGGWDHHNNMRPTTPGSGSLNDLMTTLANGLAAFYTDVINVGAKNVTLVVMSEFGRRVKENGSAGTDHGHGNCMLVLGPAVAGGRVLANWPGLAAGQLFQNFDLEVTIDYRDILAEILAQRAGATDLPLVFPDFAPTDRGVLI